jgi:hypothetical protein
LDRRRKVIGINDLIGPAALDVVRGLDFNDRMSRIAGIREELEREHRNGEI